MIGGLSLAGARWLSLWRTFSAFRRRFATQLDDTTDRFEATERRLGGGEATRNGSLAALLRLQDSLARLAVLADAAGQAAALVRRVRGAVPSK